jgi:bifunctional enzyme CysN/CysC
VGDGKSTLIGRLLYDCNLMFEEHATAPAGEDARFAGTDDAFDLALLADGMQTEREQDISIDVSYRYFATGSRRFIVADAPGHEQYTCNMATAASTAELAVILIDASIGLLTQTRRHSHIVSLFGIGELVAVINKMDVVGWSGGAFERVRDEYLAFARSLGFTKVLCIPASAAAKSCDALV